jgi:hypothetical protein
MWSREMYSGAGFSCLGHDPTCWVHFGWLYNASIEGGGEEERERAIDFIIIIFSSKMKFFQIQLLYLLMNLELSMTFNTNTTCCLSCFKKACSVGATTLKHIEIQTKRHSVL